MTTPYSDDASRILVIDDDPGIRRTFRACLEAAGHRVTTAADFAQADLSLQSDVFDLCFIDLRIGNESSIDFLPVVRQIAPWMRIIMVTAYSSIDTAIQALRAGAVDYLIKPCSCEQLCLVAAKQVAARRLEHRLETLEKEDCFTQVNELDSANPAMKKVLETLRQVADTDASVLILGESGTGKGVAARLVHQCSKRAKGNFVTVNCPSLSAELLESELFGHKRGAFTGATENKLGRVDQAENGTLFLDEIGDVPLTLQPKLLRFIQDREYERVGDPVTRRANVRLVAATNRDLDEMVKQGLFREDLLYRINVINVRMLPLRERIEDIETLAEKILWRFAAAYHRKVHRFSDTAIAAMRAYAWPGNIRELQNVIERAVILSSTEELSGEHLSITPEGAPRQHPRIGEAISLQDLERAHITGVLTSANSFEAAAKILGIDASTLYRKRKEYGL